MEHTNDHTYKAYKWRETVPSKISIQTSSYFKPWANARLNRRDGNASNATLYNLWIQSLVKHLCGARWHVQDRIPKGIRGSHREVFQDRRTPSKLDFIQLSRSEGKAYCLVIMDTFTKWTEIFPTKKPRCNKSGKGIMQRHNFKKTQTSARNSSAKPVMPWGLRWTRRIGDIERWMFLQLQSILENIIHAIHLSVVHHRNTQNLDHPYLKDWAPRKVFVSCERLHQTV